MAFVALCVGGWTYGVADRAGWSGTARSSEDGARAAAVWSSASTNALIDVRGLEPIDARVPETSLPDGWSRVATGVYADGLAPGEGATVIAVRGGPEQARTMEELSAAARDRARGWSSLAAVKTSVIATRTIGTNPGLVRTHELRRPIPLASGRASTAWVQVRRAQVDGDVISFIGIDDAARHGSADQARAIMDQLQLR